ncbi:MULTISPECIES: hypothetical protein [Halocynthiibacter]|uniref:Tail fiber domain-containing protein n=1 Tax=Halocynthiibacter halioticoli TaxID=2986804 RepID=A0AAE3LTY4_9RHOB|nr:MULTISPECIES: hypothetical protein [Halocynthiibacter]MCV6826001.1 hypothetical protein [Halocynthiibacter halioticoli]MCW4059002.1 hypothetical protein [Halocynthiibacter sp. SDUM655004]
MGKKGGSAPKAPDANEVAKAESQYNRLNTYSPSGAGVRYGYTNSKGKFVEGQPKGNAQAAVMQKESATQRKLRQLLEPASVNVTKSVLNDRMKNMPDVAEIGDRGDIAQTIFDRNMSMMEPTIEKGNERLISNLQARGLPVGGEAFNEAYGEQQRQTQDTISRLAMDADIAAGQEQSRLYGLEADARSRAMSELAAIMGGSYQAPTSQPSGSANPINYSGAANNQYNAELSQYQQKQKENMATANAAGSIAGALIKSSINFKTVKGYLNGNAATMALQRMPIHVWQYTPEHRPEGDHGGNHVGPIAEDFHALTGLGISTHIDPIDYLGILSSALKNALDRIDNLERELLYREGGN